MLSDQKLKQIHNLVRTSNVLTDQEKTEWMALIELMNDKQVAELEEILMGPKPEPKPAPNPVPQPAPVFQRPAPRPQPVPAPQPVQTAPPPRPQPARQQPAPQPVPKPSKPLPHINASSLSHISNLPSKVNVPKPGASRPTPISEQPQSMPQTPRPSSTAAMPPINPRPHLIMRPDQVQAEPNPAQYSPASSSQQLAPRPAPRPVQTAPPPRPQPASVPQRPAPAKESVPMPPVEPKPIPQAQPVSQAAYNYTPTQNIELKSPEDVAAITSSVLHVQNRKTFHEAITNLASTQGYFQVLTSFENSPLYKDYLNYGKSMLSGRTQNLALSQEEFEFVSDILLSLKVNRV
ncbi:hypothetical protein IPM19_03525 [bacterium]|nr:MAG: hypothetical protein IPM19_03525 [bacterium]